MVATFLYNGRLSISVSSSIKNSWKESLPTRATESSDVSANADTARLISVNTSECGNPITSRKFAIAPAKICGCVVSPCAAASPSAKEATAISAITASILSMIIAP